MTESKDRKMRERGSDCKRIGVNGQVCMILIVVVYVCQNVFTFILYVVIVSTTITVF